VYSGQKIDRTSIYASVVHADHVRSGGTVAWICRNPGNIKQDPKLFAERHGAYKGKILKVPGIYGGLLSSRTRRQGSWPLSPCSGRTGLREYVYRSASIANGYLDHRGGENEAGYSVLARRPRRA
jgi:hypothetical protein